MASLYLIRHDEPELTGVFPGEADIPLSAAGREHAARALGGMCVPVVWSSPLLRAQQTAAFLQAGQRVELANLREIDHGDWGGKTWREIELQWPDWAARKSADWLGIAAPGGEEWSALIARVSTAWQRIKAGPSGSAVVAHQGVNSALACLIAGRDPLTFAQKYGEVISLEYD